MTEMAMVSKWTIAFLILFLGSALAEVPPDQKPVLRVEAGMHTAPVRAIDISSDGRLLVTGSEDKTVRLWSLPDGRLARVFRLPIGDGDAGQVFSVAISQDGRLVAAAGIDAYAQANKFHFIYIFDTASDALVKRIGPLPDVVEYLKFSARGNGLAAGLKGRNGVRLWLPPYELAPSKDEGYGDDVSGMDFDLKGNLVTSSYDGFLRLYEWPLKLIAKNKATGGDWPIGMTISDDGKNVGVAYADSSSLDALTLPHLTLVDRLRTRAGHGGLSTLAFSKDGEILFAGGEHSYGTEDVNPILRWPRVLGKSLMEIWGPKNTIFDLAGEAGGGIAYGSADPAFGILGAMGEQKLLRSPVTIDMRPTKFPYFGISNNGRAAWFKKWYFDVDHLNLLSDHYLPTNVTIFGSETEPVPRDIQLEPFEDIRSYAFAHDKQSLLVGTEKRLYRFTPSGKRLWPRAVVLPGVPWSVSLTGDGAVAVATLGDGTVRWYRVSDGQELLGLFVHAPDKRWIAWTPTGYYAASPGGEDLIGWHINGETWDKSVDFFPASRLRQRFYRPDVVRLILRTRDEYQAVREANANAKRKMEDDFSQSDLPPVVELQSNPRGIEAREREIEIAYKLRAPSGRKIDRLDIRIDGSIIRGMTVLREKTDGYERVKVVIPPRDCEVSFVAFHGDQASAAAAVKVNWSGLNGALSKPKLRALVVGISEYREPSLRLNFADDDARGIAEKIQSQQGKFFSTVEVRTLVDKDAKLANIGRELGRLRRESGREDYTLIFLAGHGRTSPQGDFYFLPFDASTESSDDEFAALSTEALYKYLGRTQGKVLMFVDACYAASGVGAPDMTGFINQMTGEDNNIYMFASSLGDEPSQESSEWGHGAFTKALLDALDDPKVYGSDWLLLTLELELALRERVLAITKGTQTPGAAKSRALVEHFNLASF